MKRSAKELKRYYIVFHGNVQGVGFRFFAQREAERSKLKGWIRNKPDGSVDMEIDGDETTVMNYLDNLKSNHPYANVSSAEIKERPMPNPYDSFHIKF